MPYRHFQKSISLIEKVDDMFLAIAVYIFKIQFYKKTLAVIRGKKIC